MPAGVQTETWCLDWTRTASSAGSPDSTSRAGCCATQASQALRGFGQGRGWGRRCVGARRALAAGVPTGSGASAGRGEGTGKERVRVQLEPTRSRLAFMRVPSKLLKRRGGRHPTSLASPGPSTGRRRGHPAPRRGDRLDPPPPPHPALALELAERQRRASSAVRPHPIGTDGSFVLAGCQVYRRGNWGGGVGGGRRLGVSLREVAGGGCLAQGSRVGRLACGRRRCRLRGRPGNARAGSFVGPSTQGQGQDLNPKSRSRGAHPQQHGAAARRL